MRHEKPVTKNRSDIKMKRNILGMLFVTVAAALVVGVGADFASYSATRSAHIAVVADDVELIDLHPGQPYAYLTDRGILNIDLSARNPNWLEGEGQGISPDSRYNIDNVFYVSNDLWSSDSTNRIKVTVTSTNDDIKLYSKLDETHYNSDTAGQSVTFYLNRGEEGDVGLDLNGFGYDAGDEISSDIVVGAVAADEE